MPICECNANQLIANKMGTFSKLIYPDLSYKLTGILFAVHNELGRYCSEKQYSDCVENYLKKLGVQYEREKILPVSFDGELRGRNKVDFLVDNKIVLELKAGRFLGREEYYQMRRYLRAADKKLGILANFRERYLHPKRILNSSAEC